MTTKNKYYKPKTKNLRLEYETLLAFHDNLQSDIKKLEKKFLNNNYVKKTVKIPSVALAESAVVKDTNSAVLKDTKSADEKDTKSADEKDTKSANEKDALSELLIYLHVTEAINSTTFSNESIQYLPADENETDIKFKKLYRADCVVCKRTKFQIEIMVNENTKNLEGIQSIKLNFDDLRESKEISSGISLLKKNKNVSLLFSAIRQYSNLSKIRENILKTLPEEFFKTYVMENGHQIIECFSKKNKYFICEWSIDWRQELHNFIQAFEITIECDDEEFTEDASPIFDNLCENVTSIEESNNKVRQWREDTLKLIKKYVKPM